MNWNNGVSDQAGRKLSRWRLNWNNVVVSDGGGEMMMRYGFLMFLLCSLVMPALAQESTPPAPIFLTDSVDPATNVISLIWADSSAQTHRPITTFNLPSECTPVLMPDGKQLLYSPLSLEGGSYIYQVNLETGASLPLDYALEGGLQCPMVNPNGESIAWLRGTDDPPNQEVIITRLDGSDPVQLASQPIIFRQLWSPNGETLSYIVGNPDEVYFSGVAHSEAAVEFWQRDAGLLTDYQWLPNGSAILVAYYTQTDLVLGRLDQACLAVGSCYPTPLAKFNLNDSIRLTQAISPDSQQVVIAIEGYTAESGVTSDLYVVNTQVGGEIRLTTTPDLTKLSAVWLEDQIYFTAARLDIATFRVTESAIYQLPAAGGDPQIAYQAEGYFPQQILAVLDSGE